MFKNLQLKSRYHQRNKFINFKFGIKEKLLSVLLLAIAVVISAVLFLVYYDSSKIVFNKSEDILKSNTQSVINNVKSWMNTTITALNEERNVIEYFSMKPEEELAYLRHIANRYDSFPAGLYIGTKEGKLIHPSFIADDNFDIFTRPWYSEGIDSEDFVFGSVHLDENTHSYVVGVSGILKDKNGNIRGVAAADAYLNSISNIVQQVQLEQTGGMFLVDTKTNMIIGHKDDNIKGTKLGNQDDEMYSYISKMLESDNMGLHIYQKPNRDKIHMDIEKIPNSEWVAVAYVPNNEIMSDLNLLTKNVIGISVISIIVLLLLTIIITKKIIINPIREIDSTANQIASGNLNVSINYKSNDELGSLASNFNKTVVRLQEYVNYIDEISDILNEISKGNLAFELKYSYEGEFFKIKEALTNISNSLNKILKQISLSANLVSENASQLSISSQNLAEGATDQASSIQQLLATTTEVSNHSKVIANKSHIAISKTDEAKNYLSQSNEEMDKMVVAMSEINKSSQEITGIAITIEDIASQTNMLALNAAIEASKAGEAGRGFAVVADEIRNLADASRQASKKISNLIELSLISVDNGTQIANDTAKSLISVKEATQNIAKTVDEIFEDSNNQAHSLQQITMGVEQISNVIQNNSSTAEKSATSSEELSLQADTLKNLVNEFKLKNI